jgi:hypothetical protein
MVVEVLDKKVLDGGKKWFLCRGSLYDYLSELKKDFSTFSIQRRIVKNRFLDGLYNTVFTGEPIPSFSLTCIDDIDDNSQQIELDMKSVEILDGLQRTFRLWIAFQICLLIKKEDLTNHQEVGSFIADTDPGYMELDFMSASYLRRFFEKDENGFYYDKLLEAYRHYSLIFSIWTGLSDEDIIKKMLILNAGQRPMSSTHQYELLFLRYFEQPAVNPNIRVKLYREKSPEYSRIKKGNRQIGEFQLSSVIIALQSMIESRPQRIAPSSLVRWDVDEMMDVELTVKYFNPNYLNSYLDYLYKLDMAISSKDAKHCQWFGKDTTLSGVFAAIGKCFATGKEDVFRLDAIGRFIRGIEDGSLHFNLEQFDQAYGELSSVRVNVGNIVRRAIYVYTVEMIEIGVSDWFNAFKTATSGRLW